MTNFPRLKTGAIAQYPLGRGIEYRTEVLEFTDGSEQRFRLSPRGRRRWQINLTLLDEGELAALTEFFYSRQGRAQVFRFTDPVTEELIENCRFASPDIRLELHGPDDGRCVLEVEESDAL